ncbi:MAG: GHKL domain-containing protein [Candidatus Cloacimonadota bacterium]|nr:MAG: GHKL domain-containing protein [Candidatus Cloacimonadota bacterium]
MVKRSRLKSKREDFLNKKLMVVLFRWITILIISIMIFYKRGEFHLTDPAVIILIFLSVSNGILTFLNSNFFEQPKYIFFILLADIISISILFRLISSENQLYLVFFAVLFISSISQNVKWSLLIAMIACIFYLSIITLRKNSDLSILITNPEIAIKIPFIFLIAIWTSFWSEQYKKKKNEEEEVEKFNGELKKGIKIAISKEKKVARDLKKMKEYNENILKSLNSGVIVVDNNGMITTMNPKAEKIFDVTSKKTVGVNFEEVKEFVSFLNNLSAVLRDGKRNGVHEVNLKNGKTLNMTFSPLKESEKENGATVVFQDVTVFKEMKDKVRQSESLANLGKTVAWIAHEIRNILTNIIGYAQLIEMKFNNSDMKEYLDGLMRATEKISVLMTDILDFSKQRKIKKEEVNINSLLKEIEEGFSNSLNGTRLVVRKEKNIDTIFSNHRALQCVISNLIKNAKEAIEENGKKGEIELNLRKNNEHVIFEVSDTGRGIEEDKIKSIFNAFFTTKKNGTGLGLSIVKKVVESLDGDISVRSKPGEGTKFSITLPEQNGILDIKSKHSAEYTSQVI